MGLSFQDTEPQQLGIGIKQKCLSSCFMFSMLCLHVCDKVLLGGRCYPWVNVVHTVEQDIFLWLCVFHFGPYAVIPAACALGGPLPYSRLSHRDPH